MKSAETTVITFHLEFDSRGELMEAMQTLKSQFGFAGEMYFKKNDDGTWRLTVLSEKRFKESTIQKMPGRVVAES